MRRVVTTAVAAVLTALLLDGCSGEPEVREPEPSTSPSAPGSSPTPPPLPDQADEDSDEGAVAFASHWVDTFNFAAESGSTDQLDRLSADCAPCRDFAQSIAAMSDDERPDDDTWTIQDATVQRDDVASDVTFELELLGGESSTIAFELSPHAPFTITDLYRVQS